MDPTTPLPCEGPCNAPTSHKKFYVSLIHVNGVSIHGRLLHSHLLINALSLQ